MPMRALKISKAWRYCKVRPLTDLGSPTEIIREFGTKEKYLIDLNDLENELYKIA
jgi:hypothetical protein